MDHESRGPSPESPTPEPGPAPAPEGHRIFVHEAGWSISVKRGSDRVFCHMMAPGQDYYHRLLDGELYLHQADERLCLSCAARRGVLSYEPRRLPDDGPRFLIDSEGNPFRVLGVEETG